VCTNGEIAQNRVIDTHEARAASLSVRWTSEGSLMSAATVRRDSMATPNIGIFDPVTSGDGGIRGPPSVQGGDFRLKSGTAR
jgi:hypothetical protein